MTARDKQNEAVRRSLLRCLGELGPNLLGISNASDSPNPSAGRAYLRFARAVITDAIDALDMLETPTTRRSRRAA